MRRPLALILGLLAWSGPVFAQDSVRLDQIQVIGTHNSYHAGLPAEIARWLDRRRPDLAAQLDYAHPDLASQLDGGVRQLELDIYADSQGGRFAHPKIGPWLAQAGLSIPATPDRAAILRPGLKVMHIPDIDQHASCEPLVACLRIIRGWSRAHPRHAPVFVLLEIVQHADDPALTTPEIFSAGIFTALDATLRSVFTPADLLVPDQVRGNAPTLREAVRTRGWPSLAETRGKLVVLLDQRANRTLYLAGHPSLRGRVAFTNADPADDDAAFTELNDGPPAAIEALVREHMLVRSRSDADTREARNGDTTRRDLVLRSGAQIVSTDYPDAEPARWSGYRVGFETGLPARCDPVSAPPDCDDRAIETLPPASLRLRRLVLVYRHGVRTPLASQIPPRSVLDRAWPHQELPPGALTPHGAAGMRLIGADDRAMLAAAGLLPPAGCPRRGAIRFAAGSEPRALASQAALAEGLAPGCGLVLAPPPPGSADPRFEPRRADPARFDTRALLPRMQDAVGTPADLLAPHAGALAELQRVAGCPGVGSICRFGEAPSTMGASPDNHGVILSGPIAAASGIAEALMLAYLDGRPMDQVGWGRVGEAGLGRFSALHAAMLTATSRAPAIALPLSRGLRRSILNDLTAPDGPVVSFYVGYDDTIEPLLGLLEIHVNAPGYAPDEVPIGGALGFALLTDAAGGHPTMRVLYQSQTPEQLRTLDATQPPAIAFLAVPACRSGAGATCPLAPFERILAR